MATARIKVALSDFSFSPVFKYYMRALLSILPSVWNAFSKNKQNI